MTQPELNLVLPDVRATRHGAFSNTRPREIVIRHDPLTGTYLELVGRDGGINTTFARVQNEAGAVYVTVWSSIHDFADKKMIWG